MQEPLPPSLARGRHNHRPPGGYPGLRLITFQGIPVYAKPSLLIVLALIVVFLGAEQFPQDYATAKYTWFLYVMMAVAAALLFFLSVLLHEAAHSLIAKTAAGGRIPIRRITLFFLGGLSEMTEEPRTGKGEFLIAFSGPLISILIGAITWPAGILLEHAGVPVFVTGVLKWIGWLNIFLGATNLLPGFPLDGGRVLRSIIWSATGNFLMATRISTTIGRVLGMSAAFAGGVLVFAGLLQGMFLIMVGLFIDRSARDAMSIALFKAALDGIRVHEVMQAGAPPLWQGLTLGEAANDYFMRYHAEALPVVGDGGELRGVMTASMLNLVSTFEWGHVRVKDLLDENAMPAFTRLDEPLGPVFTLMLRYGLAALPVLDAEAKVAGIVTLRDLYRLAGLRARFVR